MKLYFNSYLTTDIIMKKAIIIGASSGIGRGIAIELLNKNYKIAISARRKDKLGEIKLIQPENVIVKAFDSSTEENENNLDELVKLLGGLDLFIYCSGIGIINKELSYQKIKKVNRLNISGFCQAISWSFNFFVKQKHGHIVNISSVASEIGGGISPSYNASKAYQANFLQGLRFKSNRIKIPIKITDVRPGFVDTDILQGNKDRLFWVSSVKKACIQIVKGIESEKKVIYITRRWKLISLLVKFFPEKTLQKLF